MRILVADAHAELRQSLILQIQELGHTVEEALGLREVLEICRRKCPDLLLLDSNLSGTTGIEIAKQVRQSGGTAVWVPIVLMANHMSDEDILTAVDAGVDDFLNKPVSIALLKARIASAQRQLDLKEDVFTVAHNLVIANRALENIVARDSLTGVGNATAFEEALEREWFKAKESKKPLALLMLNLDYFKLFNDVYGVAEGDEAIKKVAKGLDEYLSQQGHTFFLARVSGPSFALLLPEMDKEPAVKMAEALRTLVENLHIKHDKSGCSQYLTISLGVTIYKDNNFGKSRDYRDEADYALYQAKHHGRNQVFVSS